MIRAKQLTKQYRSDPPIFALNRVDFAVEREERVAIVGRSGSGKTTLLNVLAGLDRVTDGSLSVDGQDIVRMKGGQLARYRAKTIGVVFQSFQLIAQKTAERNVELPLIILGVPPAERKQKVQEALSQVGLTDRMKHRPAELSGGEQQRVAIARAIVGQPTLILADEPTGNLDSRTSDDVRDLLLRVCAELRATLVLVTHDASLAEEMAQRTLRMNDGQLIEEARS